MDRGVEIHTQELLSNLKESVGEAMMEVTEQYEEDVKENLDTPPSRSGKVYHNVKGKERHQAAAPNPDETTGMGGKVPSSWEHPAPLSGELLNSISSTKLASSNYRWRGAVLSTSPYMLALEFGRQGLYPMPARPTWRTTLIENREKYRAIIESAVKGG